MLHRSMKGGNRSEKLEKGRPLINHTPAREDRAPVSAQQRGAKIIYVQLIESPRFGKTRFRSELRNGYTCLDE